MQVIRPPLVNMSYSTQIRQIPFFRDLDHEVGTGHLSDELLVVLGLVVAAYVAFVLELMPVLFHDAVGCWS